MTASGLCLGWYCMGKAISLLFCTGLENSLLGMYRGSLSGNEAFFSVCRTLEMGYRLQLELHLSRTTGYTLYIKTAVLCCKDNCKRKVCMKSVASQGAQYI